MKQIHADPLMSDCWNELMPSQPIESTKRKDSVLKMPGFVSCCFTVLCAHISLYVNMYVCVLRGKLFDAQPDTDALQVKQMKKKTKKEKHC